MPNDFFKPQTPTYKATALVKESVVGKESTEKTLLELKKAKERFKVFLAIGSEDLGKYQKHKKNLIENKSKYPVSIFEAKLAEADENICKIKSGTAACKEKIQFIDELINKTSDSLNSSSLRGISV